MAIGDDLEMSHFLKIPIFTILPLYLTLGCCGLSSSPAIAQVLPDRTLGEENSVVTPNVNIKGIESNRIDGGAQRGGNLFHSFQEFNVKRGGGVYFSNPDGVANILTRITGNSPSNILGTLGVLGNANLFFINPNGIIFGPDAQLDIQGSFYGATADSILFENGFEFATSDPQAPPLLTVNVPIGLRLPENAVSIQVEGRGHNLSLDPETFSFVRDNRNLGLQGETSQTSDLKAEEISYGFVQFDDTMKDISALINQNPCKRGQGSEFTITGQGGLPPTPRDFLTPHNISQEATPATPENIITPSQPEFIEAQGWVSTPNGIQLIVNPNTAIPIRPWLTPPNCDKLDSQKLQPYLLASTTDIIPSPNSQPLQVTIQQFNFQGNTKFSNLELQQQIKQYLNKPIPFDQLIAARTAITEYYTKNNYITSGAFIPPQNITENGTVTIQVVEGKIDEIEINIKGRLNENYIKTRLEKATIAPINQEKLLSALQLLQLDPLIDNISAELSAGVRPDTSVLAVEVITANPWQIAAITNNGRVPSVGTFRRGIEVGHGNLTGMGDSFNTLYTNTDGSDTVELSYAIPVNSRNGRIEMFYRYQDNEVIESPFEILDIQSNSHTYELSFRQPIIQTPRQEFSVGLGATRRDSQTSILGENFPLSEGANDDGETKLSILQFFQDYQLRGDNQVLALNSKFNIGLGILDATVNNDEPDSRFFYWRGQGQWVRELATDTLLVVGADVQLSPSDLVPLERFGLGGYRSVRGYGQDTRLTDNGALGTVELRLPVPWVSGKNRLFQVVPFIDGGVAWNSDGEEVSGTNALAAVGVGLQVKLWDRINLRLDYGIPLIDVDSRDRTAQEDGFYFSVSSSPFSF